MSGQYNFTIKQGISFKRDLVWSNHSDPSDPNSSLQPVDVTGMTAKFVIRDGSGVIVTLTDQTGITIGGSNGKISIDIPFASTQVLDFSTGTYDLFLFDSVGEPHNILTGVVSFESTEIQS
jgi:hypothetical protein